MSRFLLPMDDPTMDPLDMMASLSHPANSPLPVFDEPSKPQTCKTCQIMTTEMLQVRRRRREEGGRRRRRGDGMLVWMVV